MVCQSGVGTLATPSWRATSRAAWTLPSSWWRLSKMTRLSTKPRRLLAATRRLRSRTPSRRHPHSEGVVPFRVLIDGQPPGASHGTDVDDRGNGRVIEPRLYQLIRQAGSIA